MSIAPRSGSAQPAWLSRCRTELSALVPFCAPALYGYITPAELQAWAEGIWICDQGGSPEVAAHRAMVQMLTAVSAPPAP